MNNPPAFPSSVDDGETVKYMLGMSMRDYFAALAMQGMLANPKLEKQILLVGKSWIEESAWKVADAMLKTRSE